MLNRFLFCAFLIGVLTGFQPLPDGEREAIWHRHLDAPAEYAAFPRKIVRTDTYDGPGFTIERYVQANGPGTVQRVLMAVPKGISGKVPAVVVPFYFPEAMLGFNPADGSLDCELVMRPGTNLLWYAGSTIHYMTDLAKRGYVAVSADSYYLTYAKDGAPDGAWDKWTHAAQELLKRYPDWTGIGKLVFDARLLVDLLEQDPRVDASRLGIIGHSLGGKVAYYAGCLDPRIKVIVANDPGLGWDQTNWGDVHYWGAKLAEIRKRGLDPSDLLTMSGGKPFCLIAGKYDTADSWTTMQKAKGYEEYPERRCIVNHASGHEPPAWAMEKGYRFLERQLKPLGSQDLAPSGEDAYAFRERMSCLHPLRLSSDARPLAADEVRIDARWRIVPLSDDPVIRHAAADMRDYLEKSMRVSCASGGSDAERTITIGIAAETNALTARISVSADRVRISGATAREAAQGCYRLEDEMNSRGLPAVRLGERTYTRLFSPRMVHSGWDLDRYPDVYLDQVAHAGMDAVILYIEKTPDITRNGRVDVPDLVRRAGVRGIDVYAYWADHVTSSKCNPRDPGAREYYEKAYGSVVENAPGLKGMVFVGESCGFPSHDEDMGGWWWDKRNRKAHLQGCWPCSEWPDYLELVKSVTRKWNPGFEILFWTYCWPRAPEKLRTDLLERIPGDVSVLVTFELGENPPRDLMGLKSRVDDYSIVIPGPSRTFTSEAAVPGRRGMPLITMANTSGRTWDFGVVPCVPAPFLWCRRFEALREARARFGVSGVMDSHHYGFQPNFIADLAKVAFTAEYGAQDVRARLHELARRDFGEKAADAAVAAWADWSEAMANHSASWFDQYGPWRVGPVYPLVLPGENLPDPPNPNRECYDGVKYGNGWRYMTEHYYQEDLFELPAQIRVTERELELWNRGLARLRPLEGDIPEAKRGIARRQIGLAEFLAHAVRTMNNVRRFLLEGTTFASDAVSQDKRQEAGARMRAVLADEAANVRETIPLVVADSSLGWEPTMGYVCNRMMLEWKLSQLKETEKRLAAKLQ